MARAHGGDDPVESPADRADGSEAQLSFDAGREVVFAHLADPTTYPEWLVGAQRILEVDDDWPGPGSSFHHRVGLGPLNLEDRTTVVKVSEPDELVLKASIGPFGSALIRFRLEGDAPTTVHFEEAAESGLIKFVGNTLGRWAMKPTVWGRNKVALQRLRSLLETSSAE